MALRQVCQTQTHTDRQTQTDTHRHTHTHTQTHRHRHTHTHTRTHTHTHTHTHSLTHSFCAAGMGAKVDPDEVYTKLKNQGMAAQLLREEFGTAL